MIDIVKRVGIDRIKDALAGGAAPMPAFPDLGSKETENLLTYLTDPAAAHVPSDVQAYLTAPPPKLPAQAFGDAPARFWTGYGYMNSTDGLPAIKPPWSTLTAYDLNAGTIKWQIPLGELSLTASKGIKDTGSYWPRGGAVVTAGGLIFVGTKSDSKIRAYDKESGKELWGAELPAGPEGVPAVFEVGGRQYVAISARPATALPNTEGRPPVDPAAQVRKDLGETQGYYVFALADAK